MSTNAARTVAQTGASRHNSLPSCLDGDGRFHRDGYSQRLTQVHAEKMDWENRNRLSHQVPNDTVAFLKMVWDEGATRSHQLREITAQSIRNRNQPSALVDRCDALPRSTIRDNTVRTQDNSAEITRQESWKTEDLQTREQINGSEPPHSCCCCWPNGSQNVTFSAVFGNVKTHCSRQIH